jgi:pimeloyl-ACP methyl ester carboxylesterase
MRGLNRFLIIAILGIMICVVSGTGGAALDTKIIRLITEDGVTLEGRHYLSGHKKVILIAPGMSQHKDTKVFQAISESLISDYDVFTLDFRGHGKSSGLFTFSAREVFDIEAALKYLKPQYEKIGMVGFSLGAASAIVATAQTEEVDSLIAVGAPTSFSKIDFQFWRIEALFNLIDNFTPEGLRKGVRFLNPFYKKPRPVDSIGEINDTPVFFIHGTNDWIIRPHHSKRLHELKKGKKKLHIVDKGLHAEKMFERYPDDFKAWMLEWFEETL